MWSKLLITPTTKVHIIMRNCIDRLSGGRCDRFFCSTQVCKHKLLAFLSRVKLMRYTHRRPFER